VIGGGSISTAALKGSTEEQQFDAVATPHL
jgi:hypothetical protein